MKYLIYILFLLLSATGFTQNYADKEYYLVDSLVLEELSYSDKEIIENSLNNFSKCENDLCKIKSLNNICENLENKIWIKYQFLQHNLIVELFKNEVNTKEKKELNKIYASALANMGFIEEDRGNIPKALKYYHQSIKIQTKNGDKQNLANTLNNLGAIYTREEEDEIGMKYYLKSLNIRKEIKDSLGMAESLVNIGHSYRFQNKFNEALSYFNQSLDIYKAINEKRKILHALNGIAYVYKGKGDFENALKSFIELKRLKNELGIKNGLPFLYVNIAEIELELNNLESAKTYALASVSLSKEYGALREISSATEILSRVYEKLGNYKDALYLFKNYIQIRDSIHNEATQKATIQQAAKYEYEKQKAIDDAEHDKQIAIEQEAKEKQTILTYSTAGGLGLVGIFLLIVFNRLKVTSKQKNIIEEQKQEVENQKTVVEKAHTELEEKNKEITDSIQYAKRIQNAILPPSKVVKEYLQESFIYYKPKDIVAGDFYWLEQTEEKVLFAAADCTGHGVPGAMVSVVCNNGLNRSVREYGLTDPGEILTKTREIVIQEFEKSEEEVKDGMDIALCSLEGNKLQYAGAHNPLWVIRDGELLETKANKQPIGQFDNPEPYTTHTIELQKGDSLYIFSDGYADQFGGDKGKKLKTANFKKLLLSIQNESMEKQKQLIDEAFENWKGSLEQLDDVCVIGVKV